jgi:hypothetical protein
VRPSEESVVLRVERGVVLAGRLVDDRGEGVQTLLVHAQRLGGHTGAVAHARTEADGTFRFAGVPAGEVVLGATIDGKEVSLGTHRAPATDLTLVLPRR